MKQIYNPYLPLNEYVPDGEPHIFGGRVYIYGSHDAAGGTVYCEGDYVTWSAPAEDLKDWKYEGVIYRRTDDPSNADGSMQLWAPDVVRGGDGRYYLYYCFTFYPEIGVAVSDSPAGPFRFYGHVRFPEALRGSEAEKSYMPFDPAVFRDDDGRVYLYFGFAPAAEKEMLLPAFTEEEMEAMPEKMQRTIELLKTMPFAEYSMAVELEQDMLTMKGIPQPMIPGGHHTAGTGFGGHGFFEASSIRKIRGRYYFVYSSHKSHELCYACSDRPTEGYVYGGTVISNGDIGLNGRTKPVYTLSNNHGGIVQAGEDYYIFYHRATDGTECSRQGCAEKIRILEDGSIPQTEMTSCGLNGGPLASSGLYPAPIACHLTSPLTMEKIDYNDPCMKQQARITQEQNGQYITAVTDGTVIGWKYFDFAAPAALLLEVRGKFDGTVQVRTEENGDAAGEGRLHTDTDCYGIAEIPLCRIEGVHALYLDFAGEGSLDLRTIGFRQE